MLTAEALNTPDDTARQADPRFLPGDPAPGGPGMWASGDDCSRARSSMPAFLDGEADQDAADQLMAHLPNCSQCSTEMNQLREQDEAIVREWSDNAPLPHSFVGVRSIDQIMGMLPGESRTAGPRGRFAGRWGAAGLAGLIVAAVLLARGRPAPGKSSASAAVRMPISRTRRTVGGD